MGATHACLGTSGCYYDITATTLARFIYGCLSLWGGVRDFLKPLLMHETVSHICNSAPCLTPEGSAGL